MSLPIGYKQLEYIRATGTQYIDTGLVCNKSDDYTYTVDCKLANDMALGGANGYLQFRASVANGARSIIGVAYKNNIETITVNGAVNSTTDWTSSYSGVNVKIGILKLGDAGNAWYSSVPQSGDIYSAKIKKSGVLVRDFIPCKNASGVVGLWDNVNSQFYGNAGTGTFAAGLEISGTHKALIDGTTYEVTAGRTLVDATGYGVTKGRVLVNGTGYDVPFSRDFVLTMERASDSYGKQDPYSGTYYGGNIANGVEYNGKSVAFTDGGAVTVAAGDSVTIYASGAENTLLATVYAPAVYLNGVYQKLTYIYPPAGTSTMYKCYKYVYTPNGNATLKYTKKYTEGTAYTYVYITEA